MINIKSIEVVNILIESGLDEHEAAYLFLEAFNEQILELKEYNSFNKENHLE